MTELTTEEWNNYPQVFALADILALKFDAHAAFSRTLRFQPATPLLRSYAPNSKIKVSNEGINRRLLEFMTGKQDADPAQKRAAIDSLEKQHPWLATLPFPQQYYEKGMSDDQRRQFVEDWLKDEINVRGAFLDVAPLPDREKKFSKDMHKRSHFPNLPPAVARAIAKQDKAANLTGAGSEHYYEIEQATLALLGLSLQKELHLKPGAISIKQEEGKSVLRLDLPDDTWQDQVMRALEPHFRAIGMKDFIAPVYDESNTVYGGQAHYAVDIAIEDIAKSPELRERLRAHTMKYVDANFAHRAKSRQTPDITKPLFHNINDEEAADCIKYCSEFPELAQAITALSKLEGNKHPITPDDIRYVSGDNGEGRILVVRMNPADTEGKTCKLLEKHFRLSGNGNYITPDRMVVDFDPAPTAEQMKEIQTAGGPEAGAEETGVEDNDVIDPVSVIKIQSDKMLGIDKADPADNAAMQRTANRRLGRFVDYVKKAVKPPRRVL